MVPENLCAAAAGTPQCALGCVQVASATSGLGTARMPILGSATQNNPRDIANLVPTPDLLRALGFDPNERTRRARCILHAGSNPNAFSWRDGLWRCHVCQRGGDRIALVREAKECSFSEAVRFLAMLAGVEFCPVRQSAQHMAAETARRFERERLARDLITAEAGELRDARENLIRLRSLWRSASARRFAVSSGEPERFPNEMEIATQVMGLVSEEMARADAAYCLIAFAAPTERYAFILHPERRDELIDAALDRHYVADEKGYRFEVGA
jgi:hypothetical protein